MYDARVIANTILDRAWELGEDVTQIDIQKICYFLHGHHIKEHGKPMIKTEFEAWGYGPVQRVLYSSFKNFGDQPITSKAVAFDPIRRVKKELPEVLDNAVRNTIEEHLPKYLGLPSFSLVKMTHEADTPWSITMRDADSTVNLGMRISDKVIADNFEGIDHA